MPFASDADDSETAQYKLRIHHLLFGYIRAMKLTQIISDDIIRLCFTYFYPGLHFKFESTYDTNGILYWLGTDRGASSRWSNPAASSEQLATDNDHNMAVFDSADP